MISCYPMNLRQHRSCSGLKHVQSATRSSILDRGKFTKQNTQISSKTGPLTAHVPSWFTKGEPLPIISFRPAPARQFQAYCATPICALLIELRVQRRELILIRVRGDRRTALCPRVCNYLLVAAINVGDLNDVAFALSSDGEM
jgi:hypothetical protein